MINFVIVEDNKNHKKHFKDIIISFMMKNRIEFNITEFCDDTKELHEYMKNTNQDTIYILDLELPNGDGINIARTIRHTINDWRSPIIICTAHTSMLYEVFRQKLQILDFIGKCFDVEKNLSDSLSVCLKMLNNQSFYRYTYHNVDYCISYDDIKYIQRNGRRAAINTKNKVYYQNISINEMKQLLPSYFVISTKGTLINMHNISKIDWNEMKVYFKDNTSAYLVSASHRKELLTYGI